VTHRAELNISLFKN